MIPAASWYRITYIIRFFHYHYWELNDFQFIVYPDNQQTSDHKTLLCRWANKTIKHNLERLQCWHAAHQNTSIWLEFVIVTIIIRSSLCNGNIGGCMLAAVFWYISETSYVGGFSLFSKNNDKESWLDSIGIDQSRSDLLTEHEMSPFSLNCHLCILFIFQK